MDQELLQRLRAAARRLFPRHGLLAVYAHGSRVSGRPRPASDLDVGYYLLGWRDGKTLPLSDEMALEDALTRAVGVEVDLRDLAGAPLELRGRALVEGVRVYSGDEVGRVTLERELLARYHDSKDAFRQMHEMRLRPRAGQSP
jgi:predicted nucleotidyltransferase